MSEQASVEVRTVTEWRVRAWLTICEGRDDWEPAVLMCRTVTTTTTAWTPTTTTHEAAVAETRTT